MFGLLVVLWCHLCGATATAVDEPVIRVLLTPKPVKEFKVGFDAPVVFRNRKDPAIFEKFKAQSLFPLTVNKSSFVVGKVAVAADSIEAVCERDYFKTQSADYRGRLQFHRVGDDRFRVMNVVPLESYVASVLDGEMPIEFGDSARMAQAVAIRTYALFQQQSRPASASFDVHASTQSQKYHGLRYRSKAGRWLSGETRHARSVAQVTRGLVLMQDDQLLCAYFSACCGGRTTDGEYFPGSPLTDVLCDNCQDCPLYRWDRTVPLKEVSSTIGKTSYRKLQAIHKADSKNGEVELWQMHFENGPLTLTGTDLRTKFFPKWPSHRFSLKVTDQTLTVKGSGHGHGVGLCQWGARGLSRNGSNCLQILQHYYPDAKVVRLK